MICSTESCEKRVQARGLCAAHYKRAWKSGAFVPRAYQGRKGRRVGTNGYVYVWAPDHPLAMSDGYVAEHRKVVYDAGVDVPPGHHVHHRNHDRADNRLDNLEVITEADHHREHVKVGMPITNQFGTTIRLVPEEKRELNRERCREYQRRLRDQRRTDRTA